MIDRPDQTHNHAMCACGHRAYFHTLHVGGRGQCGQDKCRPRCQQFETPARVSAAIPPGSSPGGPKEGM